MIRGQIIQLRREKYIQIHVSYTCHFNMSLTFDYEAQIENCWLPRPALKMSAMKPMWLHLIYLAGIFLHLYISSVEQCDWTLSSEHRAPLTTNGIHLGGGLALCSWGVSGIAEHCVQGLLDICML